MTKLTRKQQLFVQYLVEMGDERKAALAAGYGQKCIHVEVHRLVKRRPHVLAAIEAATLEAFSRDAPIARRVLLDIATTGRNEQARIMAADRLLARSLGPVEQRHRHIIQDDRSDAEIMASLRATLASNPDLAAALIGGPTIDGKALPVGSVIDDHGVENEKSADRGHSGDDSHPTDGARVTAGYQLEREPAPLPQPERTNP